MWEVFLLGVFVIKKHVAKTRKSIILFSDKEERNLNPQE